MGYMTGYLARLVKKWRGQMAIAADREVQQRNQTLDQCAEDLENALRNPELLEDLAALEHRQWRHWAENIADEEEISDERWERWESLFVPYQELPEDVKESDREWAREVLATLEGNGDDE